jgi:hypothetical protein
VFLRTSLSGDGSTLVVGANQIYRSPSQPGYARVYTISGSTVTQKGADIVEANAISFGTATAISRDGSRVAVGAPGNGSPQTGQVMVYDWNAGTSQWTQVGSTIAGDAGDFSGSDIAMSDDGSTIIVGARYNDDVATDAGTARVYDLIANSWTQRGADIDGVTAGELAGDDVAISGDGLRVAISATSVGNGKVRVFDWNGSAWIQQGADIDGEAASDQFGAAIALSRDGTRLIASAYLNDGVGASSGHVRVFDWNAGTSQWVQVGADIDGVAAGDQFGYDVDITDDGDRILAGAIYNDAGGSNAGHVRVYDFVSGSWTQVGESINGLTANHNFGSNVSLSGDGQLIAVGSFDGSTAGDWQGSAGLFAPVVVAPTTPTTPTTTPTTSTTSTTVAPTTTTNVVNASDRLPDTGASGSSALLGLLMVIGGSSLIVSHRLRARRING